MRNLHDAEDVVAETLRRVLVRFPVWPSWEDVWAWAARVSRNLVVSNWRRGGRMLFEPLGEADLVECIIPPQDVSAGILVDSLRRILGRSDVLTLSILEAGEYGNQRIAQLRGLTVRAVEQSRARIRECASRAGISPDYFAPKRSICSGAT